jgi:flagellar P-ring protein precursor FlgI
MAQNSSRNCTRTPILSVPARLITAFVLALTLSSFTLVEAAEARSRIKDLTDIEGVRDNQLIGYGLIVGLDGTGDSLRNAPFTKQSLQSMLERLGVNTRGEQINSDTVAAVMVTANLHPFATQGVRIDINVAALGDARSLRGGTLLVTPLFGADGEIYAVAQGPLAVGGYSAEGEGGSVTKGVPTNGRISNGAIVEREIKFDLKNMDSVRLSLRNPDFTTARRISRTINRYLGMGTAVADDPATVTLNVPKGFNGTIFDLVADIEQLRVDPDQRARVIIDENQGIIVMGANTRVSTVAIAQGSLTISVTETPQVSQPSPFSEKGETAVVPRTDVGVEEGGSQKLMILDDGVSLQKLVDGLNALGIAPRDMISILQTIKAAGALQADIEVI